MIFALGLALSAAGVMPGRAWAVLDVGFQDSTLTVAPGDTFTVSLVVPRAGERFNAFDASVRFDPAMLSFETSPEPRGALMTAACSNTFHRFSAAPDSLRITVSLLCGKTSVTGPGAIYRVRFRAGPTPGKTTLSLGPSTEFYRAGLFLRPLRRHSLAVTIARPDSDRARGQ